jgi:hypothetical protein
LFELWDETREKSLAVEATMAMVPVAIVFFLEGAIEVLISPFAIPGEGGGSASVVFPF